MIIYYLLCSLLDQMLYNQSIAWNIDYINFHSILTCNCVANCWLIKK